MTECSLDVLIVDEVVTLARTQNKLSCNVQPFVLSVLALASGQADWRVKPACSNGKVELATTSAFGKVVSSLSALLPSLLWQCGQAGSRQDSLLKAQQLKGRLG